MAKTIEIKNGTTKTLTIKQDSVINFVELDKNLNNFSFNKSGKNLIITNNNAKIKLTIKNYFTSQNGGITESKLSAIQFKGLNQVSLLSNDVKNRADYKTPYYDKTKNIYYGTMWDDTITIKDSDYSKPTFILGSGKDKITTNTNGGNVYTGSGENEIHYWAVDTSDNRVYLANEGKTNLVLESTSYRKMINHVSATKDGSLRFKINDAAYYIDKYLKTGANKDIKITVNEGTSIANEQKKTYALQSYLNNQVKNEYGNIAGLNYFGNSGSKKKQTVKGNFLNNTLVGGKKADKIYCIGGTNTVTGGLGNDKLYAGSGADTFKFNYGTGWGKDTIYNAGSTDKVQFISMNPTDSAFRYVKKGNNLVIQAYATIKGKWKVADTITVKDYFKADKGKSINDKNRLGYINNTLLNDIPILVNAVKTQNLGKGKFEISLGKKNSTVVLDKTADVNFLMQEKYSFNPRTYVETLNYQYVNDEVFTKKGNDLVVQYYNYSRKYNILFNKVKHSTKKNTITIKDYFSSNFEKAVRGKTGINITNVKVENENIQGLLNNCNYIHLTSSNNLDKEDLKSNIKRYRIDSIDKSTLDKSYWVTGSNKNERITITNSKYNYIDSRGGNDVIHADGGTSGSSIMYSSGFDNCITGTSNDTYYVGAILKSLNNFKKKTFNKNSKLLVNDKGGSADNMYISAKAKNLRIMFNVNKDGKVSINQTEALLRSDKGFTDSLLIFNKSALTGKNIQKMIKNNGFNGAIEIDNWFGVGNSTSSPVNYNKKDGQGYIEKIYDTKGKELNMSNWISQVKNDVVNWLTTGKYANKFDSVADVLNSNDTKAINSLVAVFAKDTYK